MPKYKIRNEQMLDAWHDSDSETVDYSSYLINNIQQGDSILDLGSGSGILSIVSQMYGAKKITAIEFDSVCENNFFENLSINNIKEDSIELLIEDVLSWDDFEAYYNTIILNSKYFFYAGHAWNCGADLLNRKLNHISQDFTVVKSWDEAFIDSQDSNQLYNNLYENKRL